MPDYKEILEEHELQTTVANIIRLIDSASEIDDLDALSTLSRIGDVVKALQNTLKQMDPAFAPTAQLTQLNKVGANLAAELGQFLSTGKTAPHLNTADSHLNSLIIHMAPLVIGLPPVGVSIAEADLDNYRASARNFVSELTKASKEHFTSLGEKIDDLSEQIKLLSTKVREQSESVDKQKARIDSVIESFQSQFSSDQQTRNTEFAKHEKSRDTEFEESESARSEEWDKLVKDVRDAHAQAVDQHRTAAEDTIAYLEKKKTEAANLVKVTANITVTGNYNKMANSERNWGRFWRFTATGLMIASIVLAWKAVEAALSSEDGYDLKAVLLRIGIAVVIGGPAIYVAREAEKHRRSEKQYRRMELELASIDPYIESLPPEERDKLKQKLADRLFAQSDSLAEGKDDTAGFLEELVRNGWNTFLRKVD